MSLYSSLYSGISGLSTNGMAMSVIGDNIANINTIGYKRSRANFQDMLANPIIAVGDITMVGRGAMLQDVDQQMTQGSFVNTGNGLDMAISGNGFFAVSSSSTGDNAGLDLMFTRSGQFQINADGFIVSPSNLRLQGYLADTTGKISEKLSDLKLTDAYAPAKQTGTMKLEINLDAREDAIAGGFNLADVENTSSYQSEVTVYDSLGIGHDLTVHYTKTADNAWTWNVVVPASDTLSGNAEIQASGTLAFEDGKLRTVTTTSNNFTFNGGVAAQDIEFDFGDAIDDGGTGMAGSSQYGAKYNVSYQSQDGYKPGDLQTVLIDEDGVINGTFTNGQRRVLGQVAVATFQGHGLKRMGSNVWSATGESGEATIGTANSGGRGSINSSVLEQSNVDLSAEFVSMITAQRGFQASSRTITTADQLLQETLQIKR